MEAKVNYAAVGIFVLLLGAAFIAGVLWLSAGGATRKPHDIYYAYFDESVSGLTLDAPVRYRGVEVGRVRRIAIAADDIERVQLTMTIERGTPVKADTVAVLRMQGLTGIAHVELTGGRSDSPPLVAKSEGEYPVIPTAPSFLVRLDTAVSALLTNVNRSSRNFNELMNEENRRAFSRAVANLEVVSRTLAERSSAIDASLTNTARLTGELSQLIARVQRSADGFDRMAGELAGAGTSTSGVLDSARDTLDGARAAMDSVRTEARQFAAETLPEAQYLIADLRELTASLRRLSEEVESNPSVLLYGRPAPKRGPGE